MRKSRAPAPVTAAFDRGPAKYFHGRKDHLRVFNALVTRAAEAQAGTTFLIQGAPGAGKTALLTECARLAQKRGWETAEISSAALWDPDALLQSLTLRSTLTLDGVSVRVGVPWLGEAEISADRSPETVETLLRVGKKPLLLTLDEAQRLGESNEFPANRIGTARQVLTAIHNGTLTRPVILVAAGLGTTKDAFRPLGVSRWSWGAFVELGALDKAAEGAVLHDWLTKDGGAIGDPTEWIAAIAQETHGWPQHILAYTDPPAVTELQARNGVMTSRGLTAVLEAGRAARAAYYEGRVDDWGVKRRRAFAEVFMDVPFGGCLDMDDVIASLARSFGSKRAKKIFKSARNKGVLYRHGGEVAIPIPSMQDWLVSKYARTQNRDVASRLIAEGHEKRAPALPPKPSRDVQEPGSRRDFGR